jgi:hypothetical protein
VEAPLQVNLNLVTTYDNPDQSPGTIGQRPVVNRLAAEKPLYGLEVGVLRSLGAHWRAGLGAGLSASFNEQLTDFRSESYTRLLLPVYARLEYDRPVGNKLGLTAGLRAGYQFHDHDPNQRAVGRDEFGSARIQQRGGLLAGAQVGIFLLGIPAQPRLTVGYSYHRFRYRYYRNLSIDNFGPTGGTLVTESNPVAHHLRFGLEIRL